MGQPKYTSFHTIKDYSQHYSAIMKFEKNKAEPLHRWYPFVEGYSREFIEGIIDELDYQPKHCLDPFVGSGTTPVQLERLGIKCSSFEVSPFMYFLARTKLQGQHDYKNTISSFDQINEELKRVLKKEPILLPPNADTFTESSDKKKWLYDKGAMDGLLDIKYAISKLRNERQKNIFNVAFASILLTVSNVYRNGKCVSYKKNWQNESISREAVHEIFYNKIQDIILPDIKEMQLSHTEIPENYHFCYNKDAREGISKLDDNSIDLLITSPPYLNSRDYTDIYRLELWMLDMVSSLEDLRALRKKTLISHVQISHGNIIPPHVDILNEALTKIQMEKDKFWNKEIPNMICGYFRDLDFLFSWLHRKMKTNSKIFLNVANSSYFGVEIKVDEILAEVAEQNGFVAEEIRIARYLSPSSKQKVAPLRESVIVVSK